MKQIKLGLLLPLVGMLLCSGCIYSHRAMAPTGRTIIVQQEPPPPRQEVRTISPGPTHTWVEGYWAYSGNRWVWVPGHWENRPRTDAVWMPGHWDKDPAQRGWVWTPGHWE